MHRRIACLAADCCCVRLVVKDQDCLRMFEGGDFISGSNVALSSNEATDNLPSLGARRNGVLVFATWKARWLLMVSPHGRACLFEYNRNRLLLSSTFDSPMNTAAALMLDDDVEDCALVVFGTDEGPRASKVHVARLTFSSESFSIKPLKSWCSEGSVSSLARFGERMVLVGYSSCEGVGIFDAFSLDDTASPTLGSRQRQAPRSFSATETRENEKEEMIRPKISGHGIPVWVMTKNDKVITLTRCGTMHIYDENDLDNVECTIYLGFDCLGMRSIPTVEAVVVCGWRGETALIDLSTGQVARFSRTRETARVDDFAISVSSDSRLLILHVDADDPTLLRVFDFGRAALLGSSKYSSNGLTLEIGEEEDELVFLGTDEPEAMDDSQETKALVKEAWDLMVEESEI